MQMFPSWRSRCCARLVRGANAQEACVGSEGEHTSKKTRSSARASAIATSRKISQTWSIVSSRKSSSAVPASPELNHQKPRLVQIPGRRRVKLQPIGIRPLHLPLKRLVRLHQRLGRLPSHNIPVLVHNEARKCPRATPRCAARRGGRSPRAAPRPQGPSAPAPLSAP